MLFRSAVVLTGSGFDAIRGVRIGGLPVAIQARSPHSMFAVIPWTAAPAETEIVFEGGDPAFDATFPFTVSESAPEAVVFIHEDFGSLVTEASPARPGELLHIYATGLGPVTQSGSLFRTLLPWEWTWLSAGDTPAGVLFSGLAPGFEGWYQVELRLPEAVDRPLLYLQVRQANMDGNKLMGPIPVAP